MVESGEMPKDDLKAGMRLILGELRDLRKEMRDMREEARADRKRAELDRMRADEERRRSEERFYAFMQEMRGEWRRERAVTARVGNEILRVLKSHTALLKQIARKLEVSGNGSHGNGRRR